jgi:hypothetical protein
VNHDRFLDLLPDLLRGHLPFDVQAAAESHAGTCRECADALRAMVIVHHPSSEAIVQHALDVQASRADEKRRIEEHLESCGSCLEEVRASRESAALAVARSSRPETQRAQGLRLPLAAAAALALVLVYPAWLGLVRLPSVSRSLEQLKRAEMSLREEAREPGIQRHLEAGGIARVTLLRSTTRSGAEPPVVRLSRSTGLILLGVEFMLPPDVSLEERLAFELRTRGSELVWSSNMRAEEGITALRQDGMIVLLVPADRLDDAPAEFQLEISLEGEPRRQVAALPFRLERGP